MIAYREFKVYNKSLCRALGETGGGLHRFWLGPLSLRDFPETEARVATTFSRAKRQPKNRLGRYLKRLLLRVRYNGARRWFAANPHVVAVAWNGLGGSRQAYIAGARDAGAATLHAELAPLPGKITLDYCGVNAEGSVPQDPNFFRDWAKDKDVTDWRRHGQGLKARASRRSDVGQSEDALPETPFLFCPLQVPGDSQVTLFSGWCGGMEGYLDALRQAALQLPDGWHLRIKEHPSAKAALTSLIAPLLETGRVVLDNQADSFAQIAASRAVVTLNSSMGLQAFFHDKPVIALGRAFWSLPGLATQAKDQSSLDALFANPGAVGFDPDLRAAFMAWLGQVYYPDFTAEPFSYDAAAFAAKIAQAKALSPAPPLG